MVAFTGLRAARITVPGKTRFLNRRAWNVTIRTKDATVTVVGAQYSVTGFAVIEKLAGVNRHGFGFLVATRRACDLRLRYQGGTHFVTVAGYPAFKEALAIASGFVCESSNFTTAVLS